MKIKKVKSWSDIKKHPAVKDTDSEEQFGETMCFINLKDGFKNSDDDVHQLNALSTEVVSEFNRYITTCDCETCKQTKLK